MIVHFLLKDPIIFIQVALKSLSYTSTMLKYSRRFKPIANILTWFTGDILSWLFLIVFLIWILGFWFWGDFMHRCWFLDLFLFFVLDVYFVPQFLLSLLIFRHYGSWMLQVLLTCLTGMFTWITWWCWRLGCGHEWRRRSSAGSRG